MTEFYSDCIAGQIMYEKEMPTELFVPQYNLSRILVRKVATDTLLNNASRILPSFIFVPEFETQLEEF